MIGSQARSLPGWIDRMERCALLPNCITFMIVRLLVANDKANVKKVVLRNDSIVGRSSDCNLRIASNEVSRRHCSILLSELPVRIRDLGSANGTILNGHRIQANTDVPLPSGSELEIGNVRFVVQYQVPIDAEDAGSTAEVDNSALFATRKEPAPKPQKTEPPPPPPLRQETAESPAETIEQETVSDNVGDTVNEVSDVDQRAANPTPQQLLDASPPADDSEETVSFDGSEFPSFDEPAANAFVPGVQNNAESAVPSSSSGQKKSGGWKSLFGLFRKSPSTDAAAPDDFVPAAASEQDTVSEFAAASVDDETIRIPPEELASPVAAAPQDLEMTLPIPGDHVVVDEEEDGSGTAIHAESSVNLADETTEPAETDDDNLQNFFQQLSQD